VPRTTRSEATTRIILDTDPGVDDALAICLALRSPELDVAALTTVCGNVAVDLCSANALRVLDLGRPERRPPVFQGEAAPLARPLVTAAEVHGEDGLGGATGLRLSDGSLKYPPSPVPLTPGPAPEAILDLIARYPDELVLVAVGPLTNVARAVQRDPARMRRLQRIVLMGGAFRVYGNTTPVAEFNIYVDPHAAQIVLDLGAPVTIVPLDVTQQCVLRPAHLADAPEGGLLPFVAEVTRAWMEYREDNDGFAGNYLHDPLAVAVAFDPSLVETRRATVRVEAAGEHTLGQTIADLRDRPRWNEAPNADVAVAVDSERFLRLFLDRLRGAPSAA
jgi:purine nucleosidase